MVAHLFLHRVDTVVLLRIALCIIPPGHDGAAQREGEPVRQSVARSFSQCGLGVVGQPFLERDIEVSQARNVVSAVVACSDTRRGDWSHQGQKEENDREERRGTHERYPSEKTTSW